MFVNLRKAHTVLAERCWSILQELRDGSEDTTHGYALRHGVAHLLEAGRRADARALILDVHWLMARGDDGMGIIADCKRLEGDRTAALIAQAVGLSLPDLRKDPRRLAGQLVGRLVGAAGEEGYGAEIAGLLQRVRTHPHGFRWWCPVSPVLEQAGGACLKKLEGHTGSVESVSFSGDGKQVVSGSYDKTVRVWDVESGAELRKFEGHTHDVRSVSFSGDGKQVVSGSCLLYTSPSPRDA